MKENGYQLVIGIEHQTIVEGKIRKRLSVIGPSTHFLVLLHESLPTVDSYRVAGKPSRVNKLRNIFFQMSNILEAWYGKNFKCW